MERNLLLNHQEDQGGTYAGIYILFCIKRGIYRNSDLEKVSYYNDIKVEY